MNSLRSAGERLGRYALAKRQAVQQEDFNAARLRKEQIEMYKASVLDLLQVDKLLEKEGFNTDNDVCSELYTSKPTLPSAPSLQDVANALTRNVIEIPFDPPDFKPLDVINGIDIQDDGKQRKSSLTIVRNHSEETPSSPLLNRLGRSPVPGSPSASSNGSIRRRNKSVPRNTYENYDDQAIPTLRQ